MAKCYFVSEFKEDSRLERQLLKEALEQKLQLVVIASKRLGRKTARWIVIGNCIRNGAVITGLTSLLVTAALWREPPIIPAVLSGMSLFYTTLYKFGWCGDPCVQYQLGKLTESISLELEENNNNAESPTILRYHSNTTAKYFHRTVTLAAVGITAWRIYKWMQ